MKDQEAAPELARKGNLTAHIAATAMQQDLAYALRYKVFCEQAGAGYLNSGRETDTFDEFCDHILLSCPQAGVIGTCRLLPQERALAGRGFYSSGEYELEPLLARHPQLRFLELGRSCIAPSHRSSLAASLLWQAIWTYVRQNRFDVMMGCASFEGADVSNHIEPLAYLAAQFSAPEEWQVTAVPGRGIEIPASHAQARGTLRKLPPLLKGYVRLGAYVSREAVVDRDFNTTDIFVTLPVSHINPRYFAYYGTPQA